MIAILFSANPSYVTMDDAINHLNDHSKLYWEVGYKVKRENFEFPLLGFIYINGQGVNYKIVIEDIIPFSTEHYKNSSLAEEVKPKKWQEEYKQQVKQKDWKTAYVITSIEECNYQVTDFYKINGEKVQRANQSYIRVSLPHEDSKKEAIIQNNNFKVLPTVSVNKKILVQERGLEDIAIANLEIIESGLRLISRQLSTPAGRLDIFCKDKDDNYVVIELKKSKGNDQIVGQISRYIGWAKKEYNTDKVRGIIIVSKKDTVLDYAVSAISNVIVKEFKISIE